MSNLIDRFIKYVKIDTQSDENSKTCPSTKKQFDLANLLVKELNDLGLSGVDLDENGYVMATLPSNLDYKIPTIGFLAHMDTSPDMSGTNVNPQFVENYDGKDIVLDKSNKIILSVSEFPELQNFINKTLITTDGTTLLGADDKAGIAEIMTALEYLTKNPDLKHGTIKVGFTPDEEIGRGADLFDVKKFGADFAFTLDGGEIGTYEYENFNAATAEIEVCGKSVHPGYAKDKMINSMQIAMEFNSMLPANKKPEYTEKYEGFFHLIDISGNIENTKMRYLIRDHDRSKFDEMKQLTEQIGDFLNRKYGESTIQISIKDSYYNMKEKILESEFIISLIEDAIRGIGLDAIAIPVRGGTDGSRLSYMGLPTPNIFSGGHNFHGRYEFIAIESMEKAVEAILTVIETATKKFATEQ